MRAAPWTVTTLGWWTRASRRPSSSACRRERRHRLIGEAASARLHDRARSPRRDRRRRMRRWRGARATPGVPSVQGPRRSCRSLAVSSLLWNAVHGRAQCSRPREARRACAETRANLRVPGTPSRSPLPRRSRGRDLRLMATWRHGPLSSLTRRTSARSTAIRAALALGFPSSLATSSNVNPSSNRAMTASRSIGLSAASACS